MSNIQALKFQDLLYLNRVFSFCVQLVLSEDALVNSGDTMASVVVASRTRFFFADNLVEC